VFVDLPAVVPSDERGVDDLERPRPLAILRREAPACDDPPLAVVIVVGRRHAHRRDLGVERERLLQEHHGDVVHGGLPAQVKLRLVRLHFANLLQACQHTINPYQNMIPLDSNIFFRDFKGRKLDDSPEMLQLSFNSKLLIRGVF